MATLMQASRQWASRPDDERYTSLDDMLMHFRIMREHSVEHAVQSRAITAVPETDHKGLSFVVNTQLDSEDSSHVATHHAFSQLAVIAQCPAGYLRTLPAPLAADCLNYGLKIKRAPDATPDVGLLLNKTARGSVLRAATGPRYGRIWNEDVVSALVERFGDGISGTWRVPGEFGQDVVVNKNNTTMFAGDRDMFVFLADERNRVEIKGRRDGKPGSLARGFFVWNSEVGSKTFGLGTFLFDYVCCNRIVWGAEHYSEVKIRHTKGAPDRFLDEMKPALISYANASNARIDETIKEARAKRIDDELDTFLANRFGKRLVEPLKATHEAEEGRPIETLWDASVAVSAYAKAIPFQDQRVTLERAAGNMIKLAA